MTEREALKMALEALEHEAEIGNDDAYRKEREAIREALAHPEQEPVAWMTPTGVLYRTEDVDGCFDETHIPLYTTPPQRTWVGLTDEEIDALALDKDGLPNSHLEFARAIEAAHGIKE